MLLAAQFVCYRFCHSLVSLAGAAQRESIFIIKLKLFKDMKAKQSAKRKIP